MSIIVTSAADHRQNSTFIYFISFLSNPSSDELFECVSPFCGVSASRNKVVSNVTFLHLLKTTLGVSKCSIMNK